MSNNNKHSIYIDEDLFQEIYSYCKLNDLKVNQFCNDSLKTLLAKEKFGDVPFGKMKTSEIPFILQKNEPEIVEFVLEQNVEEEEKVEETPVVIEEEPVKPVVEKIENEPVVKAAPVRKPRVRKL